MIPDKLESPPINESNRRPKEIKSENPPINRTPNRITILESPKLNESNRRQKEIKYESEDISENECKSCEQVFHSRNEYKAGVGKNDLSF